MNNYANFKSDVTFTDVHNSSLEINYQRGFADSLGFRDGKRLQRAATVRFLGSFSNTDNFDLINLRLFTNSDAGNTAKITNFYAFRMEAIRGVNANIVTNGWGIYMQPAILKNYFGGFVGIGTTDVTNALTVSSTGNPLKLIGLQSGSSENKILTTNSNGIITKNTVHEIKSDFFTSTTDITLSYNYGIYIHEGHSVTYTLSAPSTRTGKLWKIVNIGTGIITTSLTFHEGDTTRNTTLNKSGAYSYTLFSDGTKYIAL